MHPHIIYIMGVSGAGKTTIGQLLSANTGIPFFDADDYHSAANKAKMQSGIPLTDHDRHDWLKQLHQLALTQSSTSGAIIACSALKEKYRTLLSNGIRPIWIFLQGTYEQLHSRITGRHGHYMPAGLLASQLETLEVPTGAVTISIKLEPKEIIQIITNHLNS